MLAFQVWLVTVSGLGAPAAGQVPFQPPAKPWPAGRLKVRVQPLMAVVPLLVMRAVAPNPVPPVQLITYVTVQPPVVPAVGVTVTVLDTGDWLPAASRARAWYR